MQNEYFRRLLQKESVIFFVKSMKKKSRFGLGSAEWFGKNQPKGSVSAEPENPGSVAH